jgi:hypothetical protein
MSCMPGMLSRHYTMRLEHCHENVLGRAPYTQESFTWLVRGASDFVDRATPALVPVPHQTLTYSLVLIHNCGCEYMGVLKPLGQSIEYSWTHPSLQVPQ